jgi:hypothetical protein
VDENGISPEARVGRRGEQKRRWDEAARHRCACGALIWAKDDRCRTCYDAERRAARDLRRAMIADLWGRGATRRTIADAIGTTPGTIGVEVIRMRHDGWDLAKRGPFGQPQHSPSPSPGPGPAHPEPAPPSPRTSPLPTPSQAR